MKRRWIGILSAFFLVSVNSSAVTAVQPALVQQEMTIQTADDAEIILKALFSEDKETLKTVLLTNDMQKALVLYGGLSGLSSILKKQLGTPSMVEAPVLLESSPYTVYLFPCTFDVGRLGIQMTVDADGALAGIITTEAPVEEDTEAFVSAYRTVELSVPILDGTLENAELPGTLTLPEGDGPFPTVVMVHGSGPSDRTETIGQIHVFTDLAEGLAAQGIAVFCYDKRTYVYGRECAEDSTLTIREETITDAVQAVQMLAAVDKVDETQIYVLGHSLGGYTLPEIDKSLQTMETAEAGLIYFAAPARPLPVLLKEQIIFLAGLTELTEAEASNMEQILAQVELVSNPKALEEDSPILGGYADYWKSLDALAPLSDAKELSVPCLVLQGEEDYQVTMEDFSLWKDTLSENALWNFESFPGLTHAFTQGSREEGASVYEIPLHVSEEVIDAIASFVKGVEESEEIVPEETLE